MDLDSITVAIKALDGELATLTTRRRLLAELAATYEPTPVDALGVKKVHAWVQYSDEQIVDPAPAPAPKTTNAAEPKQTKWDYPEVARIAAAAAEDGRQVARALADHYAVTIDMGRYLLKRCREKSLLDDASRLIEPIGRHEFDPQVARDAMAGAPVGPVTWIPGSPGRPANPNPSPTITQTVERFTTDDAAAALERAS
jgi:hypothetical protein